MRQVPAGPTSPIQQRPSFLSRHHFLLVALVCGMLAGLAASAFSDEAPLRSAAQRVERGPGRVSGPVDGAPRSSQRRPVAAWSDTPWILAASGADYLTTERALSHCVGCSEGNPALRSSGSRAALKLGTTAAAAWTCRKLRKSGHSRAATILRWAAVAVWAGAATSNATRH
jgi:hypothetical protein